MLTPFRVFLTLVAVASLSKCSDDNSKQTRTGSPKDPLPKVQVTPVEDSTPKTANVEKSAAAPANTKEFLRQTIFSLAGDLAEAGADKAKVEDILGKLEAALGLVPKADATLATRLKEVRAALDAIFDGAGVAPKEAPCKENPCTGEEDDPKCPPEKDCDDEGDDDDGLKDGDAVGCACQAEELLKEAMDRVKKILEDSQACFADALKEAKAALEQAKKEAMERQKQAKIDLEEALKKAKAEMEAAQKKAEEAKKEALARLEEAQKAQPGTP